LIKGVFVGIKPLTQTTGRRKAAIARARLRPGTGKVTVNGRTFENYFPNEVQRAQATEALRVIEAETAYDVDADIQGGGIAGQAGALRMAIARSILDLDPEKRLALRKAGLLTRDSRKKESKKYGLKKARKAPQYTKR
jgi:small subunit ribosomal protein S9